VGSCPSAYRVVVSQRFAHAFFAGEPAHVNPGILFLNVHRPGAERLDFARDAVSTPAMIDAINITVMTPMITPNTVRKRAQLVGAQGAQRHPEIFENVRARMFIAPQI
jgi:hypothetical protein